MLFGGKVGPQLEWGCLDINIKINRKTCFKFKLKKWKRATLEN